MDNCATPKLARGHKFLGKTLEKQQVIQGDCLEVLRKLPDDCIDLIMTSPPYADARKGSYEGVPISEYVKWFRPINRQLLRVLKPQGSFVLNIKERANRGERQTYVLELILDMKRQGWRWVEEYIWHKRNSYPGKWKNRFRDGWERCLHFTKSPEFNMYQNNVMVPVGDWAKVRLKNLSDIDRTRDPSKVGSGFAKKVENWLGREYVNPDNVLHFEGVEIPEKHQLRYEQYQREQSKRNKELKNNPSVDCEMPTTVLELATESNNRGHSASFPVHLPGWFIDLFTDEPSQIVLDPFLGSGTTAIAAIQRNRRWIGIEKSSEFHSLAQCAIDNETSKRS